MEGVVCSFMALALEEILFLDCFSWSFVHLGLEHVEGDVLVNIFLGYPLDQIIETLLTDGILIAPERVGFDLHKIGDVDESGFQLPGRNGLYFFLKGLKTRFMVDDSSSMDGFKRMCVFFYNQFCVLLFILFLEVGFNCFEIAVGLSNNDHGCEGKLIFDI